MGVTYGDEGIVLRRVDYGEHDRVLTVLTRHHGKLGVMARGVRKAGSRMAANTDLFARSRMQFAHGRGRLEVLTQAERSGPVAPLQDARRAACASLCAELSDRVLEGDHPLEPGLFDLVAAALDACADPQRDPRAAAAWFARRMIDRLGYAPQLHGCANCATDLPELPAWFSAAGGGLLCSRCATSDPGAVECSVRVIKVLRTMRAPDDVYFRLRLRSQEIEVLEAIMERELAQHVDRRLRSLEVLRAIWPAATTRP